MHTATLYRGGGGNIRDIIVLSTNNFRDCWWNDLSALCVGQLIATVHVRRPTEDLSSQP